MNALAWTIIGFDGAVVAGVWLWFRRAKRVKERRRRLWQP